MLVLVTCHDRPDSGEARTSLMPRHGPYITHVLDRFLIAGWTRVDGAVTSSVIMIEAVSVDEARAIFMGDPYFGPVWDRIDVLEFQPTAGRWIGGKTW